jgi:ribosomal protein S18 acetylase RimI-like enzyme
MVVMRKLELTDGRTVLVRGASAGDIPDIARLLGELSPESFRARFQGGVPTPSLVARLARVDQLPGTVCIVAARPPEPQHLVAEARYVPIGGDAAELAVTVLDGYQRSGLGEVMLDALVDRAHDAGIDRMRAVVSLTNGPMLRLLRGYGWTLAEPTDECAVACLEISATGGMPGWPKHVTGQWILVEQKSWYDDRLTAALRTAGHEVRHCSGPDHRTGRACPLVSSGECRLAEEADRIVPGLPAADPHSAAVIEAHRRMWPGKLPS